MKRFTVLSSVLVLLSLTAVHNGLSQEDRSDIHVIVNLVQLNVAVTDKKGNYVTGLRPEDFIVTEDNIPEKLASFAEGDEASRAVG